MKLFKILSVSALALLTLAACNKEPENEPEQKYDEAYYASIATVSSTDSNFTAADDSKGGAISFAAEGGEVTLTVDCGTEWTVQNYKSDVFPTDWDVEAGTLTVSADQNFEEEVLSTEITLLTTGSRIEFATITVTQDAYNTPTIKVETTEWNVPAVGEDLSTEIGVESSLGDFEVEVEDEIEWLFAEKTGTGIKLTAENNEDPAERTAKVTVTSTDGLNSASATITVTQAEHAYVTLSSNEVTFYEDEDAYTVTVESNFDWDFSCGDETDWLTVERAEDGSGVTVSVTRNETGNTRESKVTVTAGDGENVAEADFTISQTSADVSDMIFILTTTAANNAVMLPLSGDVDCTVNWGDNTAVETVTSTYPTHVYETAGEYTVAVNGTVTALNCNSLSTTYKGYITGIKQWGLTGLTDMSYALYCCTKITSLPGDTAGSFSDVASFERAFAGATRTTPGFEEISPDLFKFATKVVTFELMFYFTKNLKEIPAGLFDNCTAANNFANTFESCTALTSIPAGLFDGCPDALSFSETFHLCSAIESIPAGLFDKNTKASNFSSTFQACSAITEIPKGLFDNCPEVTDFGGVFESTGITAIPDSLFYNNTKVEDFNNAFSSCTALKAIPAGLFDNCPEVTNFNSLFKSCSSLESIPEGLFSSQTKVSGMQLIFGSCSSIKSIPEDLFNTFPAPVSAPDFFQNCTSLESIPEGLFQCWKDADRIVLNYTFSGCSSLKEIPAKLFANLKNLSMVSYVFQNCTGLTSIPAGLFDDCPNIGYFASTFNGCTALTGESPYTEINGNKVHLYERSEYPDYFTTTPTSYSSCFKSCTGLSDYNSIPSGWGGGGN